MAKVPRVNLLDPNIEPTDTELELLMQAVLQGVQERQAGLTPDQQADRDRLVAEAAELAQAQLARHGGEAGLRASMTAAIEAARRRWGLPT